MLGFIACRVTFVYMLINLDKLVHENTFTSIGGFGQSVI